MSTKIFTDQILSQASQHYLGEPRINPTINHMGIDVELSINSMHGCFLKFRLPDGSLLLSVDGDYLDIVTDLICRGSIHKNGDVA